MNLFELAELQLICEIKNKKKKYTMSDVINYAVKIRRFLDKKGGNIEGIINQLTHSENELRRQRYIRNQEYKKKRK